MGKSPQVEDVRGLQIREEDRSTRVIQPEVASSIQKDPVNVEAKHEATRPILPVHLPQAVFQPFELAIRLGAYISC